MQQVELMGAPGSPYTRKMLALMRFRHIPYKVRWRTANISAAAHRQKQYPQPKTPLLPTYYLPDAQGELEAVTDSSPILRRFEEEYQGRHCIPTNPVLAFLNWLIEDYADEWLTKAMFHYRWHYQADIQKAGSILPRWHNISASDDEIAPLSKMISERQIDRLSYVGSNDVTKSVIEESFQRFLAIFNAHLQDAGFLFGARPASADFAIYGQLTQLALFDPTPRELITETFPRIYAWTEVMEDLSGYEVDEEDWCETAKLPATLIALLTEIGSLYLPYLHANAEAVIAGAEQVDTELAGKRWSQNPFPYQVKCLNWIKEQYVALSADDKEHLSALLADTNLTAQLLS